MRVRNAGSEDDAPPVASDVDGRMDHAVQRLFVAQHIVEVRTVQVPGSGPALAEVQSGDIDHALLDVHQPARLHAFANAELVRALGEHLA